MKEDFINFAGKTALITGSTRGIGFAVARLFAEKECRVVVNGKSEETVKKAVSELQNSGFAVDGFVADIKDDKAVDTMIGKINQTLGNIDILVNNAAVPGKHNLENTSREEWDEVIATNLTGTFLAIKAVVPRMKKEKKGVVINITSQAVIFGSLLGGISYTASKGGIVALTRGLARELGPYNIRVNSVMPGLIETEQTKDFIRERANFISSGEGIALRRFGVPVEVAGACLFLASDLSSYITGETIAVNGGMPSIFFA